MSFNDIFKSNFIDQVSAFSLTDTFISLFLAFAIGIFIFEIYRRTYKGVMYSKSFGITLIALAIITDLAIMTVTSNVVLSLGMVGALSIVRFRAAIKEPLDIAYLFWSIVVGIMLGAGMIPLAVFGSVFLGVVLLVYSNHEIKETPYILVVQCENDEAESKVNKLIEASVKRSVVKSKTVSPDGIELTFEVRIENNATGFVNSVNASDGVRYVTLVSYNGEYMA